MSNKLVPSNPDEVMVIRDVTPNVVTFSVPFLRFGTIPIGGRGTLGKTSPARPVFLQPLETCITSFTDTSSRE